MKRFVFRFESLLDLRRKDRDTAGGEVGKALEAIRRIDEQTRVLESQRADQRRDAAAALAEAFPSADRMLNQGRFDLQLQAQQVDLVQTRSKLEAELVRRRQVLVQCEAEVRRLERLREIHQETHTHESQRREQAEIDDHASARFMLAARGATISSSRPAGTNTTGDRSGATR